MGERWPMQSRTSLALSCVGSAPPSLRRAEPSPTVIDSRGARSSTLVKVRVRVWVKVRVRVGVRLRVRVRARVRVGGRLRVRVRARVRVRVGAG